MTASHTEVDSHLHELLRPSGDPQSRASRDEALGWLIAHADESFPIILARARQPSPPVVLIAALPHFGRPESVPVLAHLLSDADDPTTVVAAEALATHPGPEALTALEKALSSPRDQVVASAASALAVRNDPAACASLYNALSHPNNEVRDRIQSALQKLGCESDLQSH